MIRWINVDLFYVDSYHHHYIPAYLFVFSELRPSQQQQQQQLLSSKIKIKIHINIKNPSQRYETEKADRYRV